MPLGNSNLIIHKIMKRQKYLKPCMHIVHVEAETFICASYETVEGNAGNQENFSDGTSPAEGSGAGTGVVAPDQEF